jgi:hypothetical protein
MNDAAEQILSIGCVAHFNVQINIEQEVQVRRRMKLWRTSE